MILKAIKAFLERTGITGLYFGRCLETVPEGSLIVFPYEPAALNCGITGIAAFKRPSSPKHGHPVEGLESKIERLSEYTWEKLEHQGLNSKEHYLGGNGLLAEARDLCEKLKGREIFCEIFFDKDCQERLSSLCMRLEDLIQGEDNALTRKKGRVAAQEYEIIARRANDLRDILWSLKHDVLEDIEKVNALGAFGQGEKNSLAVSYFKEMNVTFNNIDRLEVRGRDSSGVSLLFVIDETNFSRFQKWLKEKGLGDEFEARQDHQVLVNQGIRMNSQDSGVSLAFTYKVAAEVGSLGDNVQYLRAQVRDDPIFQHLVRLPRIHHTIMAHTRWASVGAITEANCHPVDNSPSDSAWIIHACLNGDIDNYQGLRRIIERETNRSIPADITTDTKIIPLQIEKYLKANNTLEEAFRLAVNDFEGSHAIAMHSDLSPGKIFLAQKGSGQALFVGLAEDHYVPASEIYGFVEETRRYVKMNGDVVANGKSGKTQGQIFILDGDCSGGLEGIKAMYYDGTPIELADADIRETELTSRDIDRQQYPHYFLKEISESPGSVEQTVQGRLAILEKNGKRHPQILLDRSVIPARLESAVQQGTIKKIFFIGQGTAGVAAAACAELLRGYLRETDIRAAALKASEFSGFLLADAGDDTLVVAITQSGTTTDTNRAVDMARERGAHTVAIVNRRDSDITFKVDGVLYTSSGRDVEMSVASTKAYYSQVVAGSILGLKLAQLAGVRSDASFLASIEQLWRLPSCMKEVLAKQDHIRKSAERFAVKKKYWAVVGSGPNKISADEIRIKLSELCYKTISSDVVEDKKHIDLSSEPLIFVCAAGNSDEVVGDIVKDTAIFKAHQAVPIVVATEGEHRFEPYADAVIYVPEIQGGFAPIINTLAGHLWGYYAALAINEESRHLFNFREEIHEHVNASLDRGLDVYEIVLDETFREKAARFYRSFKRRLTQDRYATAMSTRGASDLTLLLKYLAGKLPFSDFEFDFGVKGTAPNMLTAFFECIGTIINEMARPVDAIKHQAKTVTVGTSRISADIEGLLFDALESHGFNKNQLTPNNVLVLKRLQEVVVEMEGATLYRIEGLNLLGEPVDDTTIHLVKKEGSASALESRVETDNMLRGTKRIIVKNRNVFIGKGKTDNRSILAVPIMSVGTQIDHLLLFNPAFKEQVEIEDKVDALGGKYFHVRNLVEETSIAWSDEYLNLLDIEELFGMSAEKISEQIQSLLKDGEIGGPI